MAKQSQLDRYNAAGVKKVMIHTAHDNRVCKSECVDKDGEIVDLMTAKISQDIPPFHPNCRCIITPIIGG